jgi:uncharacterized protein YndB with AHSA1/START domain
VTSSPSSAPPRGDCARVSVLVLVEPSAAFRVFTEEIDAWWRGGLKYRLGRQRSVLHLEPKLGGRLFESFASKSGGRVRETGRITCWEPPARLVFEWRAANFRGEEKTEVEVRFEPSPSGTLVTVQHRGWSQIRADHPARHGQDSPAFIRSTGLWWGELLSSLREHVAKR